LIQAFVALLELFGPGPQRGSNRRGAEEVVTMHNMLRRESGLYKSDRVAVLRLVPCFFQSRFGTMRIPLQIGTDNTQNEARISWYALIGGTAAIAIMLARKYTRRASGFYKRNLLLNGGTRSAVLIGACHDWSQCRNAYGVPRSAAATFIKARKPHA
jgi:hypothetical protein